MLIMLQNIFKRIFHVFIFICGDEFPFNFLSFLEAMSWSFTFSQLRIYAFKERVPLSGWHWEKNLQSLEKRCSFPTITWSHILTYNKLFIFIALFKRSKILSQPLTKIWRGSIPTIEISYIVGERVIKINFGFMYSGLRTADHTWATQIQLLVNPKSLRCKSFLQRRLRGAVYVYHVYGTDLWPWSGRA